jgi:hypothetical protein
MTLPPTSNKSSSSSPPLSISVSPSDYNRNHRNTGRSVMADPSLFNMLLELPFQTSTIHASYRLSSSYSQSNHDVRSTADLIDEVLHTVTNNDASSTSVDDDEQDTTTLSRRSCFKRQKRNDDDYRQ